MTAASKYSEALALYRDTDMTQTEICKRLNLSVKAFSRYLCRRHRDILMQRHGMEGTDPERKLHDGKGQTPITRAKYSNAIMACDNTDFIEMNVSEIARIFGVSASGLANQLRAHYPDIIERRERERQRLGIADNKHRGAQTGSKLAYAEAVKLLGERDITVKEAAHECGVSFTGLRQYLQFYCKELLRERSDRRRRGMEQPRIGTLSGNGTIRLPKPEMIEKYKDAVRLYKETSLTEKEIAERCGVNIPEFHSHMRTWHQNLIKDRRIKRISNGNSGEGA